MAENNLLDVQGLFSSLYHNFNVTQLALDISRNATSKVMTADNASKLIDNFVHAVEAIAGAFSQIILLANSSEVDTRVEFHSATLIQLMEKFRECFSNVTNFLPPDLKPFATLGAVLIGLYLAYKGTLNAISLSWKAFFALLAYSVLGLIAGNILNDIDTGRTVAGLLMLLYLFKDLIGYLFFSRSKRRTKIIQIKD